MERRAAQAHVHDRTADADPRRSVTGDTFRRGAFAVDREALGDILPIVLSVLPFAAIIGVTIGQADTVPTWAGLLAGPLMYAGSAQLAAITLLEGGAGLATVLMAVAIINTRLSLYGALVEPHFRSQPGWFRWLAPHFLVDQTYAITVARRGLDDPGRFRRYWMTAGIVLGIGWTAAMTTAVLLGPIIPRESPLTFTATAVFVGFLVPQLRRRIARRPAVIAAIVALVAAPLPNGLGLLAGIIAGISPALLRPRSPS
jgi:predicted branched-subunit amino acid permease